MEVLSNIIIGMIYREWWINLWLQNKVIGRCMVSLFLKGFWLRFGYESVISVVVWDVITLPWVSYQIRKIAGCACAGNAGHVFPHRRLQWKSRHASRHVRHARAVMHVGIAYPRCRGKHSRHSRLMRNPQFYVSGKRPIPWINYTTLGVMV